MLVGRRLTGTTWPLQERSSTSSAPAAVAYLASFVFRALGWQRLFPRATRPDRSRCLAACGAAAASGVVLPFRLDYLVKISTLRRLGGVRLGLEAIGALDHLARPRRRGRDAAARDRRVRRPRARSSARRSIVVMLFCLGCIGVLALGPSARRACRSSARSERSGGSATASATTRGFSRSTFVAGGFLFGCWPMRALGSTFLLSALGVGFSPTFALVVICLAAAASILPITAGGAIVEHRRDVRRAARARGAEGAAVNFSLASGLLLTSAALVAAVVGVGGSLLFTLQRRKLARAAIA